MKFINRIKWHLKELNKVLSNDPSYYSSKRIKDWAAFITGEYILIHGFIYLLMHDKLDATSVCMMAGVAFGAALYQLNKIQAEKIHIKPTNGNDTQNT